jgi:hypothetical protein
MRTPRSLGLLLLAVALLPAMAAAQDAILILTPDRFLGEMAPLARFKRATGRSTWVVTLEQIRVTYPGADDAERVKRCIAAYQASHAINHVILVGDVDTFPVRWRWWGLPGQEGWAVSDLYYADLYKNGTTTFDTWDANSNNLYAEIEFASDGAINNDNIDFLPDISVGRVPASTDAEVTAYVNKVITYELSTTLSASWFKTAALYTGVWMNVTEWMEKVGTELSGQGFSLVKRYSAWIETGHGDPPAGVPGVIYGDLNAGVGLVSYIGHGNTGGLACLSLYTDGMVNVHNAGKLPVVLAGACDTGGLANLPLIGPYLDVNGTEHCGTGNNEAVTLGAFPHSSVPRPDPVQNDGGNNLVTCPGPLCTSCQLDPPCFAETMMFGNPVGSGTGAIGYLGARSGGQITEIDLNRFFFDSWGKGKRALGDMWRSMMDQYYTFHLLDQADSWVKQPSDWIIGHRFDEPQKLMLYGDPSVLVGGAFNTALCGTVFDGAGGPITGLVRRRVTCDVTVPAGQQLSIGNGASVLFETGRTVRGATGSTGVSIDGGTNGSYLLSPSAAATTVNRGVRVDGQLRILGDGGVRVY